MAKIEWGKLGLLGIIGYILSLPILIWKSSRIGRIVFVFLMIGVVLWGANKAVDLVNKLYTKVHLEIKRNEAIKELELVKDDIERVGEKVDRLDLNIQESCKNLIDQFERDIMKQRDDLLNKLITEEGEISLIQDHVKAIKEKERADLKERIISLKEEVVLKKRTIEQVEVRLEGEVLLDSIVLLAKEEKYRFMKDLEDIGFDIEKLEGVVLMEHPGEIVEIPIIQGMDNMFFYTASIVFPERTYGQRQ